MEKVKTIGGGKVGIPTSGKPKIEIIKSAGLTIPTVNRYEHIAEIEDVRIPTSGKTDFVKQLLENSFLVG